MKGHIQLDDIDRNIMRLLHENARISVSEIGRIISMTQPAVKERIQKLEDKGVIAEYKAKFNLSKLNKEIMAFVLFKTSRCLDFVRFCETSHEITDLYRISGEFNYLMKTMTDSMESLAVFLDSLMEFGLSSPLIVLKTCIDEKITL